jgi:hypothetical protein
MNSKAHNLDIAMYSFKELLDLFNLSYNISIDELKQAKKRVLMTHPDKSKLGPEYFLFYKKAYEHILNYYETTQKTNKIVPSEKPLYSVFEKDDLSKTSEKAIESQINKIPKKEFNKKFNKLFEENMAEKRINKNEWFSSDEPIYNIDKNITLSSMGDVIETIKKTTSAVVTYNGVQELKRNTGSALYDDDENDNQYVCSDPFGKLKYDDLRKVHKDQTLIVVSENEYKNMPKYNSVEQYNRVRNSEPLSPMEKMAAEQYLLKQESKIKESMLSKQHSSNLKNEEYVRKNKNVLASFLQLKN